MNPPSSSAGAAAPGFIPQRVFVTGGAGFIGSHLCERLLRQGRQVTCYDNFDSFYDPALKEANARALAALPGFRLVRGDICDTPAMRRALEESDAQAVVHLAALAGVRPSIQEPARYARVNVEATYELFEVCKALGLKKVVFASSSSVYGGQSRVPFREDDPADTPVSPYAATKRAGELCAYNYHHLFGFDVTSLRFFTVYGPKQRPEMAICAFIRAISLGRPLTLFGDGTSSRDYTYIDDIIDGVVASLDRLSGYRCYNLGEANPITLALLVEKIAHLVGKPPMIERQPDQPGDVPRTFADVSLARRELGYDPRVNLDEGLKRAVAWWQSTRGGTV
jgi:UDP-glucuronate 4-epimerase